MNTTRARYLEDLKGVATAFWLISGGLGGVLGWGTLALVRVLMEGARVQPETAVSWLAYLSGSLVFVSALLVAFAIRLVVVRGETERLRGIVTVARPENSETLVLLARLLDEAFQVSDGDPVRRVMEAALESMEKEFPLHLVGMRIWELSAGRVAEERLGRIKAPILDGLVKAVEEDARNGTEGTISYLAGGAAYQVLSFPIKASEGDRVQATLFVGRQGVAGALVFQEKEIARARLISATIQKALDVANALYECRAMPGVKSELQRLQKGFNCIVALLGSISTQTAIQRRLDSLVTVLKKELSIEDCAVVSYQNGEIAIRASTNRARAKSILEWAVGEPDLASAFAKDAAWSGRRTLKDGDQGRAVVVVPIDGSDGKRAPIAVVAVDPQRDAGVLAQEVTLLSTCLGQLIRQASVADEEMVHPPSGLLERQPLVAYLRSVLVAPEEHGVLLDTVTFAAVRIDSYGELVRRLGDKAKVDELILPHVTEPFRSWSQTLQERCIAGVYEHPACFLAFLAIEESRAEELVEGVRRTIATQQYTGGLSQEQVKTTLVTVTVSVPTQWEAVVSSLNSALLGVAQGVEPDR